MILSRDELVRTLADRDLDLVFGCDVVLKANGQTIDESERQDESDTHRILRDVLVQFCLRKGIGIYPGNIGRKGRFVMADALLYRDACRPLFIENLASPQAITPENIERKRALGSEEAPLRFFMTGFDFESLIGVGGERGWGADVIVHDKSDILYSGVAESRLTTRGTRRKRRRWLLPPTIWSFLRAHFGLPSVESERR
jgi:hypothetical protein